MPVALDQFVKNLTDSGVLSAGKLEKFLPPQASPKTAEELAKELVRQKQLTKYQAAEIYQGRAKSLILGNYTILDKIGAGGMGQVFKAEHRRLKRVVAIKMLPAAMLKDAVAVARFQREVEAAAKLRHTNVVATDDADEANGRHFLVMEYVEGQDLSALVKKDGPLSVPKAASCILQAVRGLEFAHKKGVVHRDIKPANLLLDTEGTVKILDMGLARFSSDGDAATQAELTGTGAVMGTVDYMAPEQALSAKHADARADIYSLGCTLFYLLTGKPIYDGETLTAKLIGHQSQPVPELRKARSDAPPELEAVFQKMVAKKVENRYQTMSEVAADLQQCVSRDTTVVGVAMTETRPEQSSPSLLEDSAVGIQNRQPTKGAKPGVPNTLSAGNGRRKKLLLIGGGLAAVLVLLAGVVFKLRTKDGTLVVEIDQPGAVVQVSNEAGKVEITRPGEKGKVTLSVDPGKHRLKVEKDGFAVYGQDFVMESGGTQSIKATLEEDKPWFRAEFKKWEKEVAEMPADDQVKAVRKKLMDLNPGFDGKLTGCYGWVPPKVENGVVTEIGYWSDAVTDISPMRALAGLQLLNCWGKGLADLSPLKGMRLASFQCHGTQVSDLSPLRELPLTSLDCTLSRVSDLSPLKGMMLTYFDCSGNDMLCDLSPLRGMPLTTLHCNETQVTDLSPLEGMSLASLWLTPKNVTEGLGTIRRMNSLSKIALGWAKPEYSPDEFWKKYDAGEFGRPPIATYNESAFKKWEQEVAKLSAEEQVKAVAKKLQELNPGFDGKVEKKFEGESVTDLQLLTDTVTDISPVRALAGLKSLICRGRVEGNGKLADLVPLKSLHLTELDCRFNGPLADLSPLQAMPLTKLNCGGTGISSLESLQGMPLTTLTCGATKVSDLLPLQGMHLIHLNCSMSNVSDLSPLAGMPLESLAVNATNVSDLTPLKTIPLRAIYCDFEPERDTDILGSINTLEKINNKPAAEFWSEVEAAANTAPDQSNKPWNAPAFKKWEQEVAKLSAEAQVKAVAKKLQELNPGFDEQIIGVDRKPAPAIENGVVTEFGFKTDWVADISPVRALAHLSQLDVGSSAGKSNLTDLSPLKGMRLVKLWFYEHPISDLSPLSGMQLQHFDCSKTKVSDLSVLKGMPIQILVLDGTGVADLSPLKGMPLSILSCEGTRVSDLSPLEGMKLTLFRLTPANITKGIDTVRRMQTLQTIQMGYQGSVSFSPAEFWKKYDAGEFGKVAASAIPDQTHKPWNAPAFKKWAADVAKLPADDQVKAVVEKLQQLNPGFDGQETHKNEDGKIFELNIDSNDVTDLSPVRALVGLKRLATGRFNGQGKLTDLSPLKGMPLSSFSCAYSQVSDLSPLKGVPLTALAAGYTQVSDLTPLAGMPLTFLGFQHSRVSDLSPIKGMPLTILSLDNTQVSDVSLLRGMPLSSLTITPRNITKGLDVVRQIQSLQTIGLEYTEMLPAAEFWQKYDAGEFK